MSTKSGGGASQDRSKHTRSSPRLATVTDPVLGHDFILYLEETPHAGKRLMMYAFSNIAGGSLVVGMVSPQWVRMCDVTGCQPPSGYVQGCDVSQSPHWLGDTVPKGIGPLCRPSSLKDVVEASDCWPVVHIVTDGGDMKTFPADILVEVGRYVVYDHALVNSGATWDRRTNALHGECNMWYHMQHSESPTVKPVRRGVELGWVLGGSVKANTTMELCFHYGDPDAAW